MACLKAKRLRLVTRGIRWLRAGLGEMDRGIICSQSKKAREILIPQKHIMGYLKIRKAYANMLKNQDAISGLLQVARKLWREDLRKAIGVPVLFFEKQTPFVPLLPSPLCPLINRPKCTSSALTHCPSNTLCEPGEKRREREREMGKIRRLQKSFAAGIPPITCFSMVVAKSR